MKRIAVFFVALMNLAGVAWAQQPSVVRVKPGFATVIVCPVPPDLVTVGNPDQFSAQSAGTFVLVKPLVSSGATNMFIKAGTESFNLVLQVSDAPDLEVRLKPSGRMPVSSALPEKSAAAVTNGVNHEPERKPIASAKSIEDLSPRVKTILSSYLKTPRPYTYSVANSDVIFAVDHMAMIDGRLYVICTLLNESRIPYDVGYVRFKLIEHGRSYIFLKKKIKEEELEPSQEFFQERIQPNSSGRLMFVFDKHGFSDKSTIEVKLNEESGRRDLTVNVPGDFVE